MRPFLNIISEMGIVGKRERGRPRIMWLDDIRHWTGMTNYGVLKRTAEDRELWRSILSTFKIEDDTWWWWWWSENDFIRQTVTALLCTAPLITLMGIPELRIGFSQESLACHEDVPVRWRRVLRSSIDWDTKQYYWPVPFSPSLATCPKRG